MDKPTLEQLERWLEGIATTVSPNDAKVCRAAAATIRRHAELVRLVGYLLSGGPYAGRSGDWDALVAAYRAEPKAVAAIGKEPK
jgi:hypothetical protein